MRIAYILSRLANSGPIIVAYDLVQLMVKNGHEVEVFYFDNKIQLKFPCPVHQISLKHKFPFDRFDIVHCHGLRPDLYILLRKPLSCKIPICTTIHSYMFEDHSYKYGKFLSKVTARIVLASTIRDDKIILLSQNMMQYYGKYLPASKLTYAYNTRICDNSASLSDSERSCLLKFKGHSVLLCSVSRLNARKGLHQIIRVLPFLENCKFCIVGDGEERWNLKTLAEDLGVSDRVLFVGAKPAGYRYLEYADIFVMPSYSEGFPLAMLEAASLGKVIVCSNIPVFRELFTDKEVTTFELDNTESLQVALLRAYKDRDSLSNNIRLKFNQSYSPVCFYDRHLDIYMNLISDKKKLK